MKDKNLTQKEVADFLGVTQSYISFIYNGKNALNINQLEKIIIKYDIDKQDTNRLLELFSELKSGLFISNKSDEEILDEYLKPKGVKRLEKFLKNLPVEKQQELTSEVNDIMDEVIKKLIDNM